MPVFSFVSGSTVLRFAVSPSHKISQIIWALFTFLYIYIRLCLEWNYVLQIIWTLFTYICLCLVWNYVVLVKLMKQIYQFWVSWGEVCMALWLLMIQWEVWFSVTIKMVKKVYTLLMFSSSNWSQVLQIISNVVWFFRRISNTSRTACWDFCAWPIFW